MGDSILDSASSSTQPTMADMSPVPAAEAVPKATPKPRNLVLMLDGTSNQFSERNSNLIKLMSVVKADEAQLLFYSSGVGTILPDSASTWGVVKQKTAAVTDLALAVNFKQFVQDGYTWLMDNYKDGDKIYLFGFSRGAYTARALAGMIERVGLLNPGNHNQVSPAYTLYTSDDRWTGSDGMEKDPAVLYRRIFGRSRPVTVEFVGVWDTVSSLGGLGLPELPFASGAKSVKFFRHALALDERRARFVPEYWRMDQSEAALRKEKARLDKGAPGSSTPTAKANMEKLLIDCLAKLNKKYPAEESVVRADGTAINLKKHKEVWFMGCHSDVGGGNDKNDEPSLSNIPFRWMLREAVQVGLVLNPSGFALQSALRLPSSLILKTPIDSQRQKEISRLLASQESDASSPRDPRLRVLKAFAEILKRQEGDAKKDIEGWEACRPYIAQLPQSILVEMVEAAARLDSYPTGVNGLDRPDGADGANGGNGSDVEGGLGAAQAASGGPRLSEDALRPYSESLTAMWRPLEAMLLGTRAWTSDGKRKKKATRMNLGRGRQMIPKQKLHRSVGLRMIHDRCHGLSSDNGGYLAPHARVPFDWPSWQEIAKGTGSKADFWED